MHSFLYLLLVSLIFSQVQCIDQACLENINIRSLDGYCNNLENPIWGATETLLLRKAPPRFLPSDLPNERTVSQTLFATETHIPDPLMNTNERATGLTPENKLNNFAVIVGQFLSHDLSHTVTPFIPGSPLNIGILIPNCNGPNDTAKTDELCIWPQNGIFTRPSVGIMDSNNIFQTYNNATSYVDLNTVYGMSVNVTNKLRSFNQGKLLTGSDNTLPDNAIIGVPNECALAGPPIGNAAGDLRSDENFYITVLHTLFLRQHNRYAQQIYNAHNTLTDEQIFQQARKLNIATFQHIIYDEWFPEVFGKKAANQLLDDYDCYRPDLQAGTWTEFATSSFRFHTMLNLPLLALNSTCGLVKGNVQNMTTFPSKLQERSTCEPALFRQYGPDAFLRGALKQTAQKFDTKVNDGIRNLRIGGPANVDVEASNLFRGRLHLIPDYNSFRIAFGADSLYDLQNCYKGSNGDPIKCFQHITKNNTLASLLKTLYGSVDRIDSFTGLMAESEYPSSTVGDTATRSVAQQLRVARDADRFWWQKTGVLTFSERDMIEDISMSDLLKSNFPSLANVIKKNAFKIHHNIC